MVVLGFSLEEVVFISQKSDLTGVLWIGDGDGFVPFDFEGKLGHFLIMDLNESVHFSIFLFDDTLNGWYFILFWAFWRGNSALETPDGWLTLRNGPAVFFDLSFEGPDGTIDFLNLPVLLGFGHLLCL